MSLLEEYKNQALWRNWPSYIESLPIRKEDTVIDIGCSIGAVTSILAKKASKVIGIDNNPELLAEATKNNSAKNIFYNLVDAKSLNLIEIPVFDGIWTSFLPAYFPDFEPVLKSWLRLLKPDGWLAMVEMSDLFSHDPLNNCTHRVFKDYYSQQLRKNLYDFEMGSRLHLYFERLGLSIIHEENKIDPELSFNGPAKPEIFSAWKARFERMYMFRQFLGDTEFYKIQEEFLSCIMNEDHSSRTIVKYIIGIKGN
jgi:ubiquinone/menaquinone biosynthesis C-methylase UbiE